MSEYIVERLLQFVAARHIHISAKHRDTLAEAASAIEERDREIERLRGLLGTSQGSASLRSEPDLEAQQSAGGGDHG